MEFLDKEPPSLISHHNQHLEITDELFDELIVNENCLKFSDNSIELSNIHVPSPDNKIQSLAAFATTTTAVFDVSFLQDNTPSSSRVDSSIDPQQASVQVRFFEKWHTEGVTRFSGLP